jgi:aconitate hydratase
MIKLIENGGFAVNGEIREDYAGPAAKEAARENTIAAGILKAHDLGGGKGLRLKFDALCSHDITYVSAIQTARASGMEKFPVPYALTNCHNSLCAVGGTINEDDHAFGLSAAVKYGGVYVPAHLAVIHTFMRETFAKCGAMILGTDSHTRYGALGTMAIGEGGGELVKQLLGKAYETAAPEIAGVCLTGALRPGVGPHDVALALIKATFTNGFLKNRVLEFFGEGLRGLSVDFRNGIDVMTTETACLTSIWETDGKVKEFFEAHGRGDDYRPLKAAGSAYYDKLVIVDLSAIEPMIALPFHPSNVFTLRELAENPGDIMRETEKSAAGIGVRINLTDKIKNGAVYADQGSIVGCAGGTFENIMAAADILRGKNTGNGGFALSVYPGSQPVNVALTENGAAAGLMRAGAVMRTAFCGPCFGAGDIPRNNGFSIRHATRNFQNREGSKPGDGQTASVALMDARSVAASAANGGRLTSAADLDVSYSDPSYKFDKTIYERRVYNGWAAGAKPEHPLTLGPGIADWPEMWPLAENALIKIAAFITDPVTTTDELIPSGETSSYRSNPLKLAEFTLSRKAPGYVGAAKAVRAAEDARRQGESPESAFPELSGVSRAFNIDYKNTAVGTCVYAVKPGDGSAREQAASCQRVLGGLANICREYATKRYLSNLLNWGILPFTIAEEPGFGLGDYIYIPGIRDCVINGGREIFGYLAWGGKVALALPEMTGEQRGVLLAGNIINADKAERGGLIQ